MSVTLKRSKNTLENRKLTRAEKASHVGLLLLARYHGSHFEWGSGECRCGTNSKALRKTRIWIKASDDKQAATTPTEESTQAGRASRNGDRVSYNRAMMRAEGGRAG